MDGAKPNTPQRHATIIGGSIAGLTTGLALLLRGWDVQIYEASRDDLESRGAGIITHQTLFDVLNVLGISTEDHIGVLMQTRKTFANDGRVVACTQHEQIATSWGRVYQLLKQQFPCDRYHSGVSLLEFEQNSSSVVSRFSDGTQTSSEILVAADGIRSTIRSKLEPASTPRYVGYIAWRGLINECDLDESERQELLPYFTFCLPEGEQVLSYPIAGEQHKTDDGERRLNVVWYRPAAADTTLMEMLTDIEGNNNGVSIAPDKVRPEIVQQMRRDATRLLSPQHAKLMLKLTQPFIQPIYDLTTQTMAYKRVAIVGDAAFTARPHIGVGITKAAEDAMTLAQSLDDYADIIHALQHFNKQRYSVNRAWIDRSRELGAYLQAQLLSENERQAAQLHRTTEAVMKETANLDY